MLTERSEAAIEPKSTVELARRCGGQVERVTLHLPIGLDVFTEIIGMLAARGFDFSARVDERQVAL